MNEREAGWEGRILASHQEGEVRVLDAIQIYSICGGTMSRDAEQRRELAASLTDRELYRVLSLFEEIRDMATIIWPGDLLAGLSLDDIQQLLRAELKRRTEAKGDGAS